MASTRRRASRPRRSRAVSRWRLVYLLSRLQQPLPFAAGNEREDLFDDLLDGDALGLGVEVGDQAMAEHGGGDGLDIFQGHEEPAAHEGAGFSSEDQKLAGAGAGAPTEPVADEIAG